MSKVAWIGAILAGWLACAGAQAGERHYYYTDSQATVLAKADVQGTILARYDYRPYGAPVSGGLPQGPGYTGHVNDADSGLVYMQQRYYDPEMGRFASVDPITPVAGQVFNLNRYAYVNNNPERYIDPDGRTCTQVNKAYSCQIDRVVTRENGKTITRDATASDHKKYAALEKALTKAVNAAANSGKTADISFKSGGSTYSFSISSTSVAKNLAGRIVNVDPADSGAMYTLRNTTIVGKAGLQPGRTVVGDEETTQQFYFLHEGIHHSHEERKALGIFGLIRMSHDQTAHQDAYNAAASLFLELNQ